MPTSAAGTSIIRPKTVEVDDAFGALEKALSDLSPGSAPGLSVLGALKGTWAAVRRHSVALNKVAGGGEAGLFLSDHADRMLRTLLDFAGARAQMRRGTPGVALLAMGSYGRREMSPYSDLDVLVLYSGSAAPESETKLDTLLGGLIRPLWDAGFTLGHAVRTPEECIAIMEEGVAGDLALETATALLEARFVSGDTVLANLFLKKDLPDFFKARGRPFVEAKLEETLQRHRRLGASIYRTQPNLKESPGALRDFQLSLWIDRASQLSGHLPRLEKRPLVSEEIVREARAGYERLTTFRTGLHGACGRKQDVLDYQMQASLAKELGYPDTEEWRGSELLLRDYFTAATAIHRLADTVIRRYREERALAERDIEQLRRRPLDRNFTRIGDHLYMARRDVFAGADWLVPAMQAFHHMARLGISLAQEIRTAIRARVLELDEKSRRHPEAARLFVELLGRRAGVGRALRGMRNVGLLGEYLPEFGAVQGLVILDVFHDFTVDEHTLFVVDYVDRLYATGDPADRFKRELLERQDRLHVLRLACLCHDLGKSRGGPGHSKRGALMIPLIAERLGLPERDTRTLIWLVDNHLLFSKTSLRRDTADPKLLEELTEQIRTRERLDLLYLLTCADISAVGQGSFTHWKDELLRELYKRMELTLEPQPGAAEPAPHAPGHLEAELLAGAESEGEREAIRRHLQQVPSRYLVEVSLDEARLHLRLVGQLVARKREALAAVLGEGPLVDVWVVTTDKAKRFAQITGAFLGMGVNIVSAVAYTRQDGLILDQFKVSLPQDGAVVPDETFWRKVCDEIERTLEGHTDIRAKIETVRRRIPRVPQITRAIEPEIKFDNKLSEEYTILDIVCGDRIGLLYGLSRALSDLGCDIHFAKVDTNRGLCNAVYYVREMNGGKIEDAEKIHVIRLLLKAVANEFQAAQR
ncbi:MAG: bifunctional uridylyltransferase/uridylyl-removing enzyme [Planctomycetota bacterium]